MQTQKPTQQWIDATVAELMVLDQEILEAESSVKKIAYKVRRKALMRDMREAVELHGQLQPGRAMRELDGEHMGYGVDTSAPHRIVVFIIDAADQEDRA